MPCFLEKKILRVLPYTAMSVILIMWTQSFMLSLNQTPKKLALLQSAYSFGGDNWSRWNMSDKGQRIALTCGTHDVVLY